MCREKRWSIGAGGARFAARYRRANSCTSRHSGDFRAAIEREKQLKRWVRAKKIALIESQNPRWKDLSVEWG